MLTGTERLAVEAALSGGELDLRGTEERAVRAEVVRDLLIGASGPVDARGLRLRGAVVVGRLDLDGLRTQVRLRLRDCTLEGGLALRGAALPMLDLGGCTTTALLADDVAIDGSVLLWRGFAAHGLVSFVGARIGGKLDVSRARLTGSLVADRITLGGDLLLDGTSVTGSVAAGTVQLTGARVAGRLSARGLRVTNDAGPALSAANLHVTDTADLSRDAVLTGAGEHGAVRLVGSRLGSLSLGRSTLVNRSGWALAAHYLDVAGTVYLDHLSATGGLRLSGGRIGGQLDVTGSTVDGGERTALAGLRLQVAQAVVLDGAELSSAGPDPTVNLRSARIAGDVTLRRTRVAHPTGTALRLNTTTVEGRLVMNQLTVTSGGVDLRDSTVGALRDDPTRLSDSSWVEPNGLTYRGMPGDQRVTIEDRLRWLRMMPAYAAQPYRQLAAAYQANGHEDEARRVLVAQQEHLQRSGTLTGWSRLRHRLFGLALQYGYQPLRAVAALASVLLLAVLLFLALRTGTKVEAGGPCPAVDRVGLAIDAAVPLVSTGTSDRCALATGTGAGQTLAAAGWLFTLLGWGSATLVVAGYSGLVRRR